MFKKYLFSWLISVSLVHANEELTTRQRVSVNICKRNSQEQQESDQVFIHMVQTGISDRALLEEKLQELELQCLLNSYLTRNFYNQIQHIKNEAQHLLQDKSVLEAMLCEYQQNNSPKIHQELLHMIAHSHESVQNLLLSLIQAKVQLQELQATGYSQKSKDTPFTPKYKHRW